MRADEMTLAQRIITLTNAIRGHHHSPYVFVPFTDVDLTVVDGILMRVVAGTPSVAIAPIETLLALDDIAMYGVVASALGIG